MGNRALLSVVGVFLFSVVAFAAEGVALKGIKPGKWTMDLAAAQKEAKAKKLPIIVNFSGSDWCGWCKVMEKDVFSKDGWVAYAKENMLMVIIDFPSDKSVVPKEYVERNEKLKTKYAIEGYPTFIVLDDDGETVLGRLSAGRGKTPESFIAELQPLFRHREVAAAKYVATLKGKDKEEYVGILKAIMEDKKAIKEQEKQVSDAQDKIKTLKQDLRSQEQSAQNFRVSKLGADAQKEFKRLEGELQKANKAFTAWLGTGPERTEENSKKYQSMQVEIQKIEGKLSKY